jgi:putative restriction endonuclease
MPFSVSHGFWGESFGKLNPRSGAAAVTKTDRLLRQFADLNVWRRGDERAPHKPLLVLYALGQMQAEAERLIPFDRIEAPLVRLLEEFGPPRRSIHPELPFYHLQTDGVWEIEERVPLTRRKGSKNPLRKELREFSIRGGFPEEIFNQLRSKPEAVRELARAILAAHFPDSLHRSIACATGLDLDATERSSRRDAEFRSGVVSLWEHRCAFCGFGVQLDNADLGLEAAHIRWCQAGGPDTMDNGLACCSIHHQAFDRGAITVTGDFRILVSSRVHGSGGLESLFLALHGANLRVPSLKSAAPREEFLAWHRSQVFRGLARDLA